MYKNLISLGKLSFSPSGKAKKIITNKICRRILLDLKLIYNKAINNKTICNKTICDKTIYSKNLYTLSKNPISNLIVHKAKYAAITLIFRGISKIHVKSILIESTRSRR